jgi:hypothetical protein
MIILHILLTPLPPFIMIAGALWNIQFVLIVLFGWVLAYSAFILVACRCPPSARLSMHIVPFSVAASAQLCGLVYSWAAGAAFFGPMAVLVGTATGGVAAGLGAGAALLYKNRRANA